MRSLLRPPLAAPTVIAQEDGMLLLEAIQAKPRVIAWRLPSEVAWHMGAFFRRGTIAGDMRGPYHGDFAPWNLLKAGTRWVLVDWEDAKKKGEPFFDVFHYLVQAHALLRRPNARTLLRGLSGEGWVASVIHNYAEGAALSAQDAPYWFLTYLRKSIRETIEPRRDTAGLLARERLIEILEG